LTTFHWILLALGVLLVAAVLLYNNLQERRAHMRDALGGGRAREDVLMSSVAETDPSRDWQDDVPDTDSEPQSFSGGVQVDLAPVSQLKPAKPENPTVAKIESPSHTEMRALDNDVECVVRMRLPKVPASDFHELLQLLRGIDRPFRMLGQREDGVWEPVEKSTHARYALVDAGLQLANRSGPVTAEQVDVWCRHLRHFVGLHGGSIECMPLDSLLERAVDLDRFCISVDVLIGLNVVAPVGYPFRGEAVHRLLTEAGMSLDPTGIYQMRDRYGNTLFSLSNQECSPFVDGGRGVTTHGLTLLLDVPRVKDGVGVFDAMIALGQRIASELSGMVVDGQGRPVSPYSLQNDRRKLAEHHRWMRARNIEPGSDRALRLFS
jgi:hypothetical protein